MYATNLKNASYSHLAEMHRIARQAYEFDERQARACRKCTSEFLNTVMANEYARRAADYLREMAMYEAAMKKAKG